MMPAKYQGFDATRPRRFRIVICTPLPAADNNDNATQTAQNKYVPKFDVPEIALIINPKLSNVKNYFAFSAGISRRLQIVPLPFQGRG
jgi:hypothetical protein